MLDELKLKLIDCKECNLRGSTIQVVPWQGNEQCEIMFIAEAPGASESAIGIPFQGAAGKVLDSLLASLNLTRGEDVYISNVCKCRPPQNRTPTANERKLCGDLYLKNEIEIVKPKLIICLGLTAASYILSVDKGRVSDLRGVVWNYRNIPVIVTYHPAYLVYNQGPNLPEIKRQVFADIKLGFETIHKKI